MKIKNLQQTIAQKLHSKLSKLRPTKDWEEFKEEGETVGQPAFITDKIDNFKIKIYYNEHYHLSETETIKPYNLEVYCKSEQIFDLNSIEQEWIGDLYQKILKYKNQNDTKTLNSDLKNLEKALS